MALCNNAARSLESRPDLLRYFDTLIGENNYSGPDELMADYFVGSSTTNKYREGIPKFFKWWLDREFWVQEKGVLIRNPEIQGRSFAQRVLSLLMKNTSMDNFFRSTDEPAVLRALTALSLSNQSTILFGRALQKEDILSQLNSVYPALNNDPAIPEEYRASLPKTLTTNVQDELGPTIAWCLHLEVLKPWLNGTFFIDFAPVLESALPQIVEKLGHTIVKVEDFIAATGAVLPFLDRGTYNSLARSINTGSAPPESAVVSEVLSAAIYRLRAKKLLRLSISPDDPNTTEFVSSNGLTERGSTMEVLG